MLEKFRKVKRTNEGEPMPLKFQDLSHDEKQKIWETLNSGSYYLFIGSGISLDSENATERMMSASSLTERLQALTTLGPTTTLQQNYRLLDEKQVKDELTDAYTCKKAGPTVSLLANTKWKRVYTLNIDNCFEKSVEEAVSNYKLPDNTLSVYNFDDLFSDQSPTEIHSVVHLHGTVEKPDSGYVFSHTEYAREMSRQNSWMATLTQLMKAEPFIVAGTSLEEIDVEFYLQQHAGKSASDPNRVQSILIEPFPNRLTERACDDHNLVLFEGTTEEFYAELAEDFPPPTSPYTSYRPVDALFPGLEPQKQILFEASFEVVPKKVEADKKGNRFLLGAPLTWEMIAAEADIYRNAISRFDRDVELALKSEELGKVYLAEPGAGKSAIMRRAAFRAAKKFHHVFYFTGFERMPEKEAAEVLNSISSDTIVFFDNAADFISYFVGIFEALTKKNIAFVGMERIYRHPYLKDAVTEYPVELIRLPLNLEKSEAQKLLSKNESAGFSNVSQKKNFDRNKVINDILSEPISVANCRIQNNFITFDALIHELIKDTSNEELKFFVLTSLARHSYSGGVSKAVLHSIPDRGNFGEIDNVYARLPVVMAPAAPGYIVPARAVVSERVLEVLKRAKPDLLLLCLVELSINLAPRVNRKTISARTPEAKLSGGLMDFDRTIQRFIDPLAEAFYEQISEAWDWNSRYWEQLALLKLSRFLEDQSDQFLLQESIQHARYAYSIDEHPLSLTTLAKTLFAALESGHGDREAIFGEGWNLIYNAIEIEKGWTRVKPTAFIVAFKGALTFVEGGGQFSGEQADEIREALAITHQRKLNDRKLNDLRTDIRRYVQK
ncbi:SIR2 family protein [Qipengyuania aquimaris]|uniref:SIR2 family protein n=1 Tax=Qipengyuania aquimaris TaxID=255984 RepID=UPI001FD4F0A4|nr:SIR2 family protein [Qipengyuania aquimaris]UOR15026.1 SIR2 family protein [Qipengyuania aquimaris]